MRPLAVLAGSVAIVAAVVSVSHADTPAVGAKAPPIELKTLDGKAASLAALTKDGPTVVMVLRGWPGYQCPLCTKQVGAFVTKAGDFAAAGVPVLLIYPGPSQYLEKHAAEFIGEKALPAGFTFAVDPDYAFTNAWGLRWDEPKETAYPSTFVVDRAGVVRYAKVSKTHGDRADAAEVLKAAVAAAATRPASD